MRFYTSASLYSNQVLERGFENGQRFNERLDYEPTLYIPTSKSSQYKTLDGRNVDAIKPGTIKDCRDFISQYKDVANFQIYGILKNFFVVPTSRWRARKVDRHVQKAHSRTEYR